MDLNAALSQLDAWSVADRIAFIEAAWDRLVVTGYQPDLDDAQRAELDRRLEHGGPLTSWGEIKANVIPQQ